MHAVSPNQIADIFHFNDKKLITSPVSLNCTRSVELFSQTGQLVVIASICRWMGNEDFQYGVSRFWKRYGWEMVFSTRDGAGNYWNINHQKSGFEIIRNGIWTSIKKNSFFILTLVTFLEHFEDFSWNNITSKCYNQQILIYFHNSFILITC